MSGTVIVVALLLAQLIFNIVTYERELRRLKTRLDDEIYENMKLESKMWMERQRRKVDAE